MCFVDLAHAAAADQHAERVRADGLVGEATGAADLERAVELGARFGEQRLALCDTAHRLLEPLHRIERDALARARGVERDEVQELDHADHAELIEPADVRHADDAAVLDHAAHDREAERSVDDRDEHVHAADHAGE